MLLAYVVVLIWVVLIALVTLLWSKKESTVQTNKLGCSLIVPFRDEASSLSLLIDSLSQQSLSNFEVIFVDDHSSDESAQIVRERLELSKLDSKLLKLEASEGKKAALTLGIRSARHDIIVTTDADCQMGAHWLASMLSEFVNEEVNLVSGPVHLTGYCFIQRFQSLELASLMGVTAATIQLNRPTMANGANLAFRKAIFFELDGYDGIDHIPSGDDELFMHKVQRAYTGSVRFNKDEKAKVITPAKSAFSEMVSQKKRWASKWRINSRWPTVMLALFVLLVNFSQLVLIYELLTSVRSDQKILWAVLLKFLVEMWLILKVRYDLKEKTNFFDLFASFLLYPVYAIYIGLAANFGTYVWKGRKYS